MMELIDSCILEKPKKLGWTDKLCVHCKKHGGPFKSHNMCNCHCINKDSTLTKGHGGTGRHQMERKCKGMNFAQIVHMEHRKHYANVHEKLQNVAVITQIVIATSTNVPEGVGWIALWGL